MVHMQANRSIRAPFLLTVSTLLVGACGARVDGTSNPPPIDCPLQAPTAYDSCTLKPGESCTYTASCQSGDRAIAYECQDESGTGWQVVPGQSCTQPYDSCPGTELYCGNEWGMPLYTNPPSPCPDSPPAVATSCSINVMGAVHERCGYSCGADSSEGWHVLRCEANADGSMDGSWAYEKTCD
jgi:hypothetical protein